jgi:predicted HNH restriction endonuclease
VLERDGYACQSCGWDERHPDDGRPLVEVDHADGDATNTRPENLRALCPNCHSMTPTFRRRNRVSKRHRSTPAAVLH